MNFLQKLDFLMERYGLNKSSMSQNSGIPYTTIDGWYKKGYDGLKLSTFKKLAEYFNTTLDFWIRDDVTDPNYGKSNGFEVNFDEMEGIKKYRSLDPYGKEAVDGVLDVEYRRCEEKTQSKKDGKTEEEPVVEVVYFAVPGELHPSGAGGGQYADYEETETFHLIKQPPRGTSFIVRVSGDSMEPTYYNGDLVFVRSTVDIRPGQIGVFFMDGQQWIKECGEDALISHNPAYDPEPFREDIRCQGVVLGVCDDSYFEK